MLLKSRRALGNFLLRQKKFKERTFSVSSCYWVSQWTSLILRWRISSPKINIAEEFLEVAVPWAESLRKKPELQFLESKSEIPSTPHSPFCQFPCPLGSQPPFVSPPSNPRPALAILCTPLWPVVPLHLVPSLASTLPRKLLQTLPQGVFQEGKWLSLPLLIVHCPVWPSWDFPHGALSFVDPSVHPPPFWPPHSTSQLPRYRQGAQWVGAAWNPMLSQVKSPLFPLWEPNLTLQPPPVFCLPEYPNQVGLWEDSWGIEGKSPRDTTELPKGQEKEAGRRGEQFTIVLGAVLLPPCFMILDKVYNIFKEFLKLSSMSAGFEDVLPWRRASRCGTGLDKLMHFCVVLKVKESYTSGDFGLFCFFGVHFLLWKIANTCNSKANRMINLYVSPSQLFAPILVHLCPPPHLPSELFWRKFQNS